MTHLSATIFLRRCVFSGVQPTTITIVTITVLDALQPLYVHEVVAMLHRRVAERRQKIHLGAVLHALGRQRGELSLGGVGLLEGAPFPSRRDRRLIHSAGY